MSWERARKLEQKLQRRRAIVSASIELFDEHGLNKTTLSAIARKSGISKANIYRYFESREAIFLSILLDEMMAWGDELQARLRALPLKNDVDGIARAFAESLSRRDRLGGLMSAAALILEHNVSVETVAAYRGQADRIISDCTASLSTAMPHLSSAQAREFLNYTHLMATGLWPHANPSASTRTALLADSLKPQLPNFQTLIYEHATVLLRGLLSDAVSPDIRDESPISCKITSAISFHPILAMKFAD